MRKGEGNINCHDKQLKEKAEGLLKEYYAHSVEDCRIIGNQKYTVSISIAVASGAILYALATAMMKSLDSAFCSFSFIGIGIFSAIMVFINLHSTIFLIFHLPLMTDVTVNIEKLQRDILFKEMGTIDCFNWNKLSLEERRKFEVYLQKQQVLSSVRLIDLDRVNSDTYSLNIEYEMSKKKYLKHGSFSLDHVANVAILIIDEVEVDRFDLRKEGYSTFLSESELKHRFRDVAPHSNVYRLSKSEDSHAFFVAVLSVVLVLGLAYASVEHSIRLGLLVILLILILYYTYEKYNSSLRSKNEIF